jgi:hypothetical protein
LADYFSTAKQAATGAAARRKRRSEREETGPPARLGPFGDRPGGAARRLLKP